MSNSRRLRQAVADVSQPLDLPESRRGLLIVEEYLSEAETCDEVYDVIADRIHGSLDQVAVLHKCFHLLKKYLLQHPPTAQAIVRVATSCQEANTTLGAEHAGLQECIAYVRHVVRTIYSAKTGVALDMGNKSSRDRKGAGGGLAVGVNGKQSQKHSARGGSGKLIPAMAQEFADSAFLVQRLSDVSQPAERDLVGARNGGASANLLSRDASGDSSQLPQQAAALHASGEFDDGLAARHRGAKPAGAVPEDLFRARWQARTAPAGAEGMATWAAALPQTSAGLFATPAEAVEAHFAAPTLRVHGDYPYDADASIAVQFQSPADVALHLHTVARHQVDQVSVRSNARTPSTRHGAESEHGKSQTGANLPTRPLFLYRPYEQQERLEMDVTQTAAVVAIVLGAAAAADLLGPQYADLLGPDLLGNDAWSVPLGKRPQGQAMASILIKLLMDMWLDMPAHESLPLVLSMLQAALEQGDAACRARVFDLLYNLSLHAHVMLPLEPDPALSATSPATTPTTPDSPTKHLFYGTTEVADHDSRLPKRVVTFQLWLRCITFQLLLDCVHLREASRDVWAAAVGCLLHLVTCQGAVMQSALSGLSPAVAAALVRHAHAFNWSLELQATLMRVACALLYVRPGAPGPPGAPADAAGPPRPSASGALSAAALEEFGGLANVLRCLRCCPTRDARHSLLAVLLDAAAERAAMSGAECARLRAFLADEGAATCLTHSVVGGHRGFGEALASTVAPHVKAHCNASAPVLAASSLMQTLLSNLEEVARASGLTDAGQRLAFDCLAGSQAERDAAWATLLQAVGSRDGGTQAIAVHALANTLWASRLEDVRSGAAARAQAVKQHDYNPLAYADPEALSPLSFLPGPSSAAHLPRDHPLQGFFPMMKSALEQAETCAFAADALIHVLHRLVSTFLLNKSSVSATNPGGIRVTVHHVSIVVAMLQGAVDWVSLLPKPDRQVPMLWISNLLLETLAVPQAPADERNEPVHAARGAAVAKPTRPLQRHAASLSPVTQLLQGLIGVPGVVAMALPPSLLLSLVRHVAPASAAPVSRDAPAAAAFQGWLAYGGGGGASGQDGGAAGPALERSALHGLAIGLASARDARLAAFLLLLGRCRLDLSALQKVGGCVTLYHAMDDEDTRVRYVVAEYILDRIMRHNPAKFQAALAEVVGSAQNNNNNDNVVENPYAQLHAFVTRGLISLDDL